MIESQKKALEQQAAVKVNQNQIPPLMPPGVDLKPHNNQNYSNNNGNSMGKTNNMIVNRNDRPSGPPPLMSQQVSIPGINMPTQSQGMNSYNNNGNTNNIDLSNFTVMLTNLSQFDSGLTFFFKFRILNRHQVYLIYNKIQMLHQISHFHLQTFSFLIYRNLHLVSRIHQRLKLL